jgi:hypothetical protein
MSVTYSNATAQLHSTCWFALKLLVSCPGLVSRCTRVQLQVWVDANSDPLALCQGWDGAKQRSQPFSWCCSSDAVVLLRMTGPLLLAEWHVTGV